MKWSIIKGNIKIRVVAFWQGEKFDLRVVKHLDKSKSLQTHSLFAFVDWETANQIDWYLRRTFTKDVIICVQTLRVIG